MDVVLGRFNASLERPQTQKFAWPIILLPELFSPLQHLVMVTGHLVSLGWEVYLLDVYGRMDGQHPKSNSQERSFSALFNDIARALDTLGSDLVVTGHGFGGLLALKLAEIPRVRAAVALAPLTPGFQSPLLFRRKRWAPWRTEAILFPSPRVLLEFVNGAEPFQHEALTKSMVPSDVSAALDVVHGVVQLARQPTPRLIITGESDIFAPAEHAAQFATKIGAQFISLPGRGHWIIGGRTLERTIALMQRFLVRSSGKELLLLYEESGGNVEQ